MFVSRIDLPTGRFPFELKEQSERGRRLIQGGGRGRCSLPYRAHSDEVAANQIKPRRGWEQTCARRVSGQGLPVLGSSVRTLSRSAEKVAGAEQFPERESQTLDTKLGWVIVMASA